MRRASVLNLTNDKKPADDQSNKSDADPKQISVDKRLDRRAKFPEQKTYQHELKAPANGARPDQREQ